MPTITKKLAIRHKPLILFDKNTINKKHLTIKHLQISEQISI